MIDLLRARTAHDFTLYKPGTLLRRIARRMIMASVALSDADRYLQILRGDQDELALLVKDLLINFTGFFRDPKVFQLLAQKIIPDLVAATHPTSRSESGLRVDFVSCRNLLIYLRPEAQAKVLSLFHFALREGGILLLGTSETAGTAEDRFQIVSKPEGVYRHIGHGRPGEFGFFRGAGEGVRAPIRPGQGVPPSRQAVLAELCQRMVMDTYAPAAVLINRKHECLYSLGPTDRFLRVVPGHPSQDLLAMARQGVRTKLRSAIQQATQRDVRVTITGGRTNEASHPGTFSIAVQPFRSEGEDGVEAVVITTERRLVADELGIAKRQADQANAAKRASPPRQATTCASRCKLLPLCKACRQRMSKRRRQETCYSPG
jgi:CheR methyltransferase, SAM binding domain/CheR methyltransferase, all-alpha domain